MAVVAEVRDDDIKELKGDIREIRSSIDVLKADVHRIDKSLAKIEAEFVIAKWLVGLTLMATLSGIGVAIWTVGTLTSDLRHLSGQVAELKRSVDLHLVPTSHQQKAADVPGDVPK